MPLDGSFAVITRLATVFIRDLNIHYSEQEVGPPTANKTGRGSILGGRLTWLVPSTESRSFFDSFFRGAACLPRSIGPQPVTAFSPRYLV